MTRTTRCRRSGGSGVRRCSGTNKSDRRKHGEFNLFTRAGRGRYLMRYRLWFRDRAGNPLTMNGFKDVGDDWGLDAWKDTTSLYHPNGSGDRRTRTAGVDDEHGRGILVSGPAISPANSPPSAARRSEWVASVVLPGRLSAHTRAR